MQEAPHSIRARRGKWKWSLIMAKKGLLGKATMVVKLSARTTPGVSPLIPNNEGLRCDFQSRCAFRLLLTECGPSSRNSFSWKSRILYLTLWGLSESPAQLKHTFTNLFLYIQCKILQRQTNSCTAYYLLDYCTRTVQISIPEQRTIFHQLSSYQELAIYEASCYPLPPHIPTTYLLSNPNRQNSSYFPCLLASPLLPMLELCYRPLGLSPKKRGRPSWASLVVPPKEFRLSLCHR